MLDFEGPEKWEPQGLENGNRKRNNGGTGKAHVRYPQLQVIQAFIGSSFLSNILHHKTRGPSGRRACSEPHLQSHSADRKQCTCSGERVILLAYHSILKA